MITNDDDDNLSFLSIADDFHPLPFVEWESTVQQVSVEMPVYTWYPRKNPRMLLTVMSTESHVSSAWLALTESAIKSTFCTTTTGTAHTQGAQWRQWSWHNHQVAMLEVYLMWLGNELYAEIWKFLLFADRRFEWVTNSRGKQTYLSYDATLMWHVPPIPPTWQRLLGLMFTEWRQCHRM